MDESDEAVAEPVFKTGMRVPFESFYVDQFGVVSHHQAHKTFAPCIGRRNECAWRRPVQHPDELREPDSLS